MSCFYSLFLILYLFVRCQLILHKLTSASSALAATLSMLSPGFTTASKPKCAVVMTANASFFILGGHMVQFARPDTMFYRKLGKFEIVFEFCRKGSWRWRTAYAVRTPEDLELDLHGSQRRRHSSLMSASYIHSGLDLVQLDFIPVLMAQ